jgi:hypothetical protein
MDFAARRFWGGPNRIRVYAPREQIFAVLEGRILSHEERMLTERHLPRSSPMAS